MINPDVFTLVCCPTDRRVIAALIHKMLDDPDHIVGVTNPDWRAGDGQESLYDCQPTRSVAALAGSIGLADHTSLVLLKDTPEGIERMGWVVLVHDHSQSVIGPSGGPDRTYGEIHRICAAVEVAA